MLRMVSYPHRPQSGHIMCYLNRTYHVLPTPLVSCSRLRRKVRLSSTFHIDAIIVSAPEIPAAASIIIVSNLIKQFGRFVALRGVNAEFAAGKLYVILGDNGAGKTTLLRALAGLAQPTRGEVSILGKNPREAC